MTALIDKLRAARPELVLRRRTEADLAFLSDLYASTREDEMRQVEWAQRQKREFLHHQFTLQHSHYLKHYPRAAWIIIEREGSPIGRLYEETTAAELRLMDISLLPAHRNRGIGGALVSALLAHADELGIPVGLHVESFNPAYRLYVRFGFATLETRGIYHYMQRPPQLKMTS